MAIRVARFPSAGGAGDSTDGTTDGSDTVVYVQTTEQPEWLVVVQRIDPETTVVSCTDYTTLYSAITPDNLDWLFHDTRPVTHLHIQPLGPILRLKLSDLSPQSLQPVAQPAQLRHILHTLTTNMFVSARGAGKADRLQARLHDMAGPVGDDGTRKQSAQKAGQSLVNPRVRKSRPAGPQFAD